MSNIVSDHEYRKWLTDLKSRIRNSQIKAALSVNSELISLYWELGRMIVEKQAQSRWGSGLIEQLAKDLKAEFPDMSGFSKSNLSYCRQFYLFYNQNSVIDGQVVHQSESSFIPQLVGQMENNDAKQLASQIPWGHNRLILNKTKDPEEAVFYIRETIANNWSRNILGIQIESDLYRRQGKAVSNFALTLPKPLSPIWQYKP